MMTPVKKQSDDYTSGPHWGAGVFSSMLGLCLIAAIAARAANTGDVSSFSAPLLAVGAFFVLLGLYAFLPGRVRLRIEPWATVLVGGLLAVFLIGAGILSLTQADLLTDRTNHVFRAPNTPTEARVAGVLLIALGLLPAIGAVVAPVRFFRRHPGAGARQRRGKTT